MKTCIFTLLAAFCIIGCNSQKNVEGDSNTDLFPVTGITVGKTTLEEIKGVGQKDLKYNLYKVRGQKFWIKDGLVDHMYITRNSEWPKKWRNYNFSWSLSYNEWLDALKDIGYKVTVIEPPRVESYREKPSLVAKVRAVKQEAKLIELTLEFKFSDAAKVDQYGSLYSIRVKYK